MKYKKSYLRQSLEYSSDTQNLLEICLFVNMQIKFAVDYPL